jgi:hypothetical protein
MAGCSISWRASRAFRQVGGSWTWSGERIKQTSTVNARDLRGLRDFVSDNKARLGLVVTNDVSPRQYEEALLGLPFNWL